jgi:hypothetical protein
MKDMWGPAVGAAGAVAGLASQLANQPYTQTALDMYSKAGVLLEKPMKLTTTVPMAVRYSVWVAQALGVSVVAAARLGSLAARALPYVGAAGVGWGVGTGVGCTVDCALGR